jgi:hypothetical protein
VTALVAPSPAGISAGAAMPVPSGRRRLPRTLGFGPTFTLIAAKCWPVGPESSLRARVNQGVALAWETGWAFGPKTPGTPVEHRGLLDQRRAPRSTRCRSPGRWASWPLGWPAAW